MVVFEEQILKITRVPWPKKLTLKNWIFRAYVQKFLGHFQKSLTLFFSFLTNNVSCWMEKRTFIKSPSSVWHYNLANIFLVCFTISSTFFSWYAFISSSSSQFSPNSISWFPAVLIAFSKFFTFSSFLNFFQMHFSLNMHL